MSPDTKVQFSSADQVDHVVLNVVGFSNTNPGATVSISGKIRVH